MRTRHDIILSFLVMMSLVLPLALGPATATAAPAQPHADEITVLTPKPDSIVNENLRIEAFVGSTFELKSVTAQVETVTTTLILSQTTTYPYIGNTGFVGNLSLLGLMAGTQILTITATDVFGNINQKEINFIYNRKPVLNIAAPGDFTVVRSELPINFSCTDEDSDGCKSVSVRIGLAVPGDCNTISEVYASTGKTGISETVTLTNTAQPLTICFAGSDAYQSTTIARIIYVESSSLLSEEAQVDGNIWDVNAQNILFLQKQAGPAGIDSLKIKNRATGEETIVMADPARHPRLGYLAPNGAIFIEQSDLLQAATARLYEWRAGALIDLGIPNLTYLLPVAGNYAMWSEGSNLFLRNLISGTTELVASDAPTNIYNSVAANGDVVYTTLSYPNQAIIRYRAGVTTTIAMGESISGNNLPATDGQNIAYYSPSP